MSGKKLIIFVKNAVAGKVKTRLAASIGDEKALEVYRLLLRFTYDLAKEVQAVKEVSYADESDQPDELIPEEFERTIQKGNDLGERMSHAFKSAIGDGHEYIVLIGSDCAELTPEIVEQAFLSLKVNNVVVGPAEDGGYYLIGMNGYYPELFKDIKWSTGEVLSKTVEKIRTMGLSFALLPKLNDVDDLEDWQNVKHMFE